MWHLHGVVRDHAIGTRTIGKSAARIAQPIVLAEETGARDARFPVAGGVLS
jgi:hypothetical protein